MTPETDTSGQSPAYLSFAEAGRLTGKDPRTLRRWEQSGKLTVDRSTGSPRVPVAELERLDIVHRDAGHASHKPDNGPATDGDIVPGADVTRLQNEVDRLERDLSDTRTDRDEWRLQAQALAEAIKALPPAAIDADALRDIDSLESENDRLRDELAERPKRTWWQWLTGK